MKPQQVWAIRVRLGLADKKGSRAIQPRKILYRDLSRRLQARDRASCYVLCASLSPVENILCCPDELPVVLFGRLIQAVEGHETIVFQSLISSFRRELPAIPSAFGIVALVLEFCHLLKQFGIRRQINRVT